MESVCTRLFDKARQHSTTWWEGQVTAQTGVVVAKVEDCTQSTKVVSITFPIFSWKRESSVPWGDKGHGSFPAVREPSKRSGFVSFPMYMMLYFQPFSHNYILSVSSFSNGNDPSENHQSLLSCLPLFHCARFEHVLVPFAVSASQHFVCSQSHKICGRLLAYNTIELFSRNFLFTPVFHIVYRMVLDIDPQGNEPIPELNRVVLVLDIRSLFLNDFD